MEHENYASKGVAGTGLGLSIGALSLAALGGGLGNVGGIFGRNGNEEHYVTHYEQKLIQENSAKDSKIALLESNIYVDSKIADVYERLNSKIAVVENQLCEQKVYNATLNGAVSCIQGQIAALQALTKTVIPNTSVCPGWGNVTVTPATTTTGA